MHFQYPQSDRALCNFHRVSAWSGYCLSFSIPNRIEPSATTVAIPSSHLPPSLSVSPIGSSPLQPAHTGPTTRGAGCFQYPQSDRALCNLWEFAGWPVHLLFQYPQSDRALCNSVYTAPTGRTPGLSVSPIGSSPLQPLTGQLEFNERGSFSIPNRIEPSATRPQIEPIPALSVFQYPQSDRALCNRAAEVGMANLPGSFSIPNRIEPSATTYKLRREVECLASFQYPQSDRALCNRRSLNACLRNAALSVSPIGSSPLQPWGLAWRPSIDA